MQSLETDQRNTVIIIGNHSTKAMDIWFKGVTSSNLWIAAESGYLYRQGNGKKWNESTVDAFNADDVAMRSWKTQVRKLLTSYAENIDGSVIEKDRKSCILWNYKNAEQEHVTMFIHDIYNGIQKVLAKHTSSKNGFEIIHGNGYLEVKPAGVKKVKLVNILLVKISNIKPIDFLFYLGNDSEDEAVFQFLKTHDNRTYF